LEIDLKTNNLEIKSLVNELVATTRNLFSEKCTAIYAMGSLARGGFSELVSDIDIGIILEGSFDGVDKKINQIHSQVVKNNPSVSNDVSIFWGSVDSINGVIDSGRYPPFDRLDLIDHALLLWGQDNRQELVRPSIKELEIASAEFAIEYLGSSVSVDEFHNCKTIAEKGTVHVTKIILYPARFIYLAKTFSIAGNEESYKFYKENFKGSDVELIEQGYLWRYEAMPNDLDFVTRQLESGLISLYSNFLDIYISRMEGHGEKKLMNSLVKWRNDLTKYVDN
jgi:hypothetical protein